MLISIRSHIKYLSILILLLAATNVSMAQSANQDTNSEITLPVLNNHKFIVNNHVRSPFIKTYFNNTLGVGTALDLQVPILDINGEPAIGLRGNLYFIGINFEYQYAVNDWLAVFTNFGIVSRIGDGAQAILAQGINATNTFELGWLMRVFETDRSLLSASVNLWNNSGTVINIYDYLKRIIDEGGISPDNELIISRNFVQLGVGLRYAWAINDLFGLNALGEFAYGESVDRRNEREIFYNLAISSDFDLMKISNVPIGFSLGLKLSSFLSGSDTSIKGNISSIFLKTAYTGEDDFLIGIDLFWRRMPMGQIDQILYGGSAVINVDYYF